METYEFKLSEPGMEWEETAVFTTCHNLTHHDAGIFARHLAKQFKREVRFNIQDSPQAHFVQPESVFAMQGVNA